MVIYSITKIAHVLLSFWIRSKHSTSLFQLRSDSLVAAFLFIRVQTLLVSVLGVTILLLLIIFLQVNAGQTFNVSLQERLPCCHLQFFLYGQTIHCLYFRSDCLVVANNLSIRFNINCLFSRSDRLVVANNFPYVVKTFFVSISGVTVLLSLTVFLLLSLFQEWPSCCR
jgi:hypothetical protein